MSKVEGRCPIDPPPPLCLRTLTVVTRGMFVAKKGEDKIQKIRVKKIESVKRNEIFQVILHTEVIL